MPAVIRGGRRLIKFETIPVATPDSKIKTIALWSAKRCFRTSMHPLRFFSSSLRMQQDRTITGQVTDASDGAPVEVLRSRPGTKTGMATKADGSFTITVGSESIHWSSLQ